jgi:hypothetical protein
MPAIRQYAAEDAACHAQGPARHRPGGSARSFEGNLGGGNRAVIVADLDMLMQFLPGHARSPPSLTRPLLPHHRPAPTVNRASDRQTRDLGPRRGGREPRLPHRRAPHHVIKAALPGEAAVHTGYLRSPPRLSRAAAGAYGQEQRSTRKHPAPGQSTGCRDRAAPDPGGTASHGRSGPKVPQPCIPHRSCPATGRYRNWTSRAYGQRTIPGPGGQAIRRR